MKIVVASGGFDPIHYGHIKYLAEAKKILIDAINEDKQKSFDKWWNYMEKDYSDNPAFFFSMLKW